MKKLIAVVLTCASLMTCAAPNIEAAVDNVIKCGRLAFVVGIEILKGVTK